LASEKPVILSDPAPRTLDLIFTAGDLDALKSLATVVNHDEGRMPDEMVEEILPQASFVIGQTDLPRERLERAPNLRAIINVEGNFRQNIDYDHCFRNGIRVLHTGSVFAQTVAEMALGMALAVSRGLATADRAFREGRELYQLDGNHGLELMQASPVGLIGFGDVGRAFRPLVVPFGCPVKVYDPWLPEHVIRAHDCAPASLDEVLSTSRFIFVFASVTADNEGFLGRRELELIQPGATFLLMSRAAVVDFDALIDCVSSGRFQAATDVFPEEPVAPDDPVRQVEGLLLSAHRAGAIERVFWKMGELVLGDIGLMLKGLPPVGCKRAEPETVAMMRSMTSDGLKK